MPQIKPRQILEQLHTNACGTLYRLSLSVTGTDYLIRFILTLLGLLVGIELAQTYFYGCSVNRISHGIELGVQTIQHTNGTDAMTIDSSGRILTPARPFI